MKPAFLISLIVLTVFSGCKKSPLTTAEEKSFPFENAVISMHVASSSMPAHTKFIHFFDESSGFAITNGHDTKSMIYKTTDKGISWQLKYTHPVTEQPLKELIFTDQTTGYAIGGNSGCNGTGCTPPGGILLKTNDGGETWSKIFQLAGTVDFVSIAANAAGHLFLMKFSGNTVQNPKTTLFKSIDGGMSWIINTTINQYLFKIVFNKNNGYLIGRNNTAMIIRSSDNGNTWPATHTFSENMIQDISFSDHTGYCMLDNDHIYKTADHGDSWQHNHQSSEYISNKLNTLGDNTCLIWGTGGYNGGCFGSPEGAFQQTSDSGITWSAHLLKEIGYICSSSFYSSAEGYILSGKLIKVKTKTQ